MEMTDEEANRLMPSIEDSIQAGYINHRSRYHLPIIKAVEAAREGRKPESFIGMNCDKKKIRAYAYTKRVSIRHNPVSNLFSRFWIVRGRDLTIPGI